MARRASIGPSEDHPRIRGEHAGERLDRRGLLGSSPHTRGARLRQARPRRAARIIPAYAGSTTKPGSSSPTAWDHPRIRGEHSFEKLPSAMARGSSPHTRGAHRGSNRPPHYRRIIPAYAGSTSIGPTTTPRRSDHPRIRGEHHPRRRAGRSVRRIIPAYAGSTGTTPFPSARSCGSSPHTRGALPLGVQAEGLGRIIPAYAGSTSSCHPYTCAPAGSSPHTRGAQYRVWRDWTNRGIIPAYAGSTGLFSFCCRFSPGSSPHTRGAREGRAASERRDRIIPAYAGSTPGSASPTAAWTDHPRIRGEHWAAAAMAALMPGSSPHTRGAPGFGRDRRRRRRIIPAYAGST